MKKKFDEKEWEKEFDNEYGYTIDGWTLGIIAETALEKVLPKAQGGDLSHITRKLRKLVSKEIAKQRTKDALIAYSLLQPLSPSIYYNKGWNPALTKAKEQILNQKTNDSL